MRVDVVIVGAGISGLVTARRLRQAGHNVLVLEKANRAGGVIETVNVDGYLIEKGRTDSRDARALEGLLTISGSEVLL
jgi:putrescine oxidase